MAYNPREQDLIEENYRLREEVDLLRETVLQLKQGLLPSPTGLPHIFGFTPAEHKLATIIYEARTVISKDKIMDRMYFNEDGPLRDILSVYKMRINRKFKADEKTCGVHIAVVWGRGFMFSPESLAVLDQLVNPEPIPEPIDKKINYEERRA